MMCAVLRITSELPGCVADWRLVIQGVGTTVGLADPSYHSYVLDYLLNMILEKRRAI